MKSFFFGSGFLFANPLSSNKKPLTISNVHSLVINFVTPHISGVIFIFIFFSYKSSMYFSFTYPKYMKLYCSNIFLQNADQGHNPTFFLLTASRERRLLVYLKGGSHDGVSKAQ